MERWFVSAVVALNGIYSGLPDPADQGVCGPGAEGCAARTGRCGDGNRGSLVGADLPAVAGFANRVARGDKVHTMPRRPPPQPSRAVAVAVAVAVAAAAAVALAVIVAAGELGTPFGERPAGHGGPPVVGAVAAFPLRKVGQASVTTPLVNTSSGTPLGSSSAASSSRGRASPAGARPSASAIDTDQVVATVAA